jgi:NADPH2:quinone reductase
MTSLLDMKALTDGRGSDVILDPVGGDVFDQCLRVINHEGRILVVGFASGRIPSVPANLILALLKIGWVIGASVRPSTDCGSPESS